MTDMHGIIDSIEWDGKSSLFEQKGQPARGCPDGTTGNKMEGFLSLLDGKSAPPRDNKVIIYARRRIVDDSMRLAPGDKVSNGGI
jgi:hypothetical protein